MKILAVVAHPDDEIIGLGGTLIKHRENGDEVYIVILGDGKTSRNESFENIDIKVQEMSMNETEKAKKILGARQVNRLELPDNRFDSINLLDIVKKIEKIIDDINPDIIYTHFNGDINIDHCITSKAVMTATRLIPNQKIKAVLMFETLSSTEWNYYKGFTPNYFSDISGQLKLKIEAMKSYQSELRDFPHPRSLKAIETNAVVWGAKSGLEAAEPFILLRGIDLI